MALLGPVLSTLYIVKIAHTSSILCTVYQIGTTDGGSLTNSSTTLVRQSLQQLGNYTELDFPVVVLVVLVVSLDQPVSKPLRGPQYVVQNPP